MCCALKCIVHMAAAGCEESILCVVLICIVYMAVSVLAKIVLPSLGP